MFNRDGCGFIAVMVYLKLYAKHGSWGSIGWGPGRDAKLPKEFAIPTPVGYYSPDWTMVKSRILLPPDKYG